MPFMMIGAQEVTDEGAKILGEALGGTGGHKYSACATESSEDVSHKGENPAKEDPGQDQYSDAERYIKTFALCIVMFGMGTMHAIIGPTLLDLAYGLSITLSEVSLVFVGQAIGFILGVAIGGVTMDLVNHWLFMGVIIMIAAFLTIAVPHWESLNYLVLASVLRGSCIRALELASNVELLDIWGKESSSPMQQLHFTVAVGCGVVPLLVKPFVGKELKDGSGSDFSRRQNDPLNYSNRSNSDSSSGGGKVSSLSILDDKTSHVDLEGSRIEWAYFIVGMINLTIGIYLLLIFCCYPRKQAKSQLEPIIEGETAEQRAKDLTFKINFISVGVLLLAVYFGVLLAFDGYLVTFAVISDLHMNFDEATTLAATFWLVFAFGRLMAVFYSLFITDFVIMQVDMVMLLLASLPLSFAASNNVTAFYVCCIMYAMSFASLGPAALSYTSKFITISGKIGAIYMIGGSTGEILLPFFIAYMMDHYDPMWLMYIVTACTLFMYPLALVKFYLAHERGEKKS